MPPITLRVRTGRHEIPCMFHIFPPRTTMRRYSTLSLAALAALALFVSACDLAGEDDTAGVGRRPCVG